MISEKPLANQADTTGADAAGESEQLLSGCTLCLEQCAQVLAAVSASDYCRRAGDTASVGAHTRHILDRYHCFLSGLTGDCIDYDARQRDPALETHLEAARFSLGSLRRRLEAAWLAEDSARPIQVRERVDQRLPPPDVSSTPAREMLALVSHSIHHLAIIALLMKARGYTLPAHIGKAPSTLAFENGA